MNTSAVLTYHLHCETCGAPILERVRWRMRPVKRLTFIHETRMLRRKWRSSYVSIVSLWPGSVICGISVLRRNNLVQTDGELTIPFSKNGNLLLAPAEERRTSAVHECKSVAPCTKPACFAASCRLILHLVQATIHYPRLTRKCARSCRREGEQGLYTPRSQRIQLRETQSLRYHHIQGAVHTGGHIRRTITRAKLESK